MIKLVVGLGNPGQQYVKTRHNAGFWFVDELVSGSWQKSAKFHGDIAEKFFLANKVLFLKPTTFMNRSGQAVGEMARYYNIEPNQILIVHDELDFEVGMAKLKQGGGHAGHNGLKDIIAHLGSKDFFRLRIGIDRPRMGVSVSDYVLSAPSKDERERIQGAIDVFCANFSQLVSGDVASVMNKLHA